jgi:hypothetical protein
MDINYFPFPPPIPFPQLNWHMNGNNKFLTIKSLSVKKKISELDYFDNTSRFS